MISAMEFLRKHHANKQLRTRSIRTQTIVIMLAFLLPLITLLLLYNFYTVSLFRDKTALSNKKTLLVYSEIAENSLSQTSRHMLDSLVYEGNYFKIRSSQKSVDRYLATYKLMNLLQKSFASGSPSDLFFIMTNEQRYVIFNQNSKTQYDTESRMTLRKMLWDYSHDEDLYTPNQWTVFKCNNLSYLVKIYGSDGVYVGVAINLENLTLPLTKGKLFDDYQMLYTTMDGQPLTHLDYISEKGLNLVPSEKEYTLSGFPDRYLLLNVPLNEAQIRMVAAIKDPTFLTTLNAIQLILFFLSILTIFLLPVSILLLRKSISEPVAQLVQTMEEIRSGNLNARPDIHYRLTEFKKVNDTFSQLMGEIHDLKIEAYEEQLAKQKAELQYLQFQIRPHFFLNSLKTLFGMAQNNETEEIKQLILALSSHFRYMFKDNFELVKLRDELYYVKNYIQILKLYTNKRYFCEIDVDEHLLDLQIPPISIQTFVENAIKHAIQNDKTLEIMIRARHLASDEGDFTSVTVTDNGPGFSPEMLDHLNFQHSKELANGHIGLTNILQRLNIIYQGQAHLAFANSTHGGAICEMIIPARHSTAHVTMTQNIREDAMT